MRKWWWLYGLFIVILLVLLSLFLYLRYSGSWGEDVEGGDLFYNNTEKLEVGYISVGDDESYIRVIVRLSDIYESGEYILADVEWGSEKQTIELSGLNDGLGFITLTKQSSGELFPVSSQMETSRVYYEDIVSELEPYLGHSVIMAFYTDIPVPPEEKNELFDNYVAVLENYIECNHNFSEVFESGGGVSCKPYIHHIYVVKE